MKASKLIKKIVNKKISEIHVALPAKIESYNPEKMIASVTLLAKNELEGESVTIPPVVEVPVKHENFGPFIIRPGYKKGDVVQVIFNERALDKLLITGDPEEVEYKRRHSLDDAVVIGGLKTEQEDDLPAEEPESLYICNLDKDAKITMNPDGTLRIANDDSDVLTEIILGKGTDSDGYIKISKTINDNSIEFVIQDNGVARITDNQNGTELKFDINNSGDAIFNLANKLFLGSSSASEGVPLGDTLQEWLDNHRHSGVSTGGGISGPPDSSSPDPSSKVMVE